MGARSALLAWYEPRRRAFPWRRGRPNPYRVLVSEVMLQQTQVSRVVPLYREFLRRFPTVGSLAEASRRDVLEAWAGLGYNRRAVALQEAARTVVRDHGGRVPSDPDELATLPGVGPYTAAAVASIGHGVPASAIDTNVARVVARFIVGREPGDVPRPELHRAAGRWLDRSDPGTWSQALMDLGREVCRPAPRCEACPLLRWCRFRPRRAAQPVATAPTRPVFQGSSRQVRGGVVGALRGKNSATLGTLAGRLGQPVERVTQAVRALASEGLVRAGPAALAGRPSGRAHLPD